MEEIILIILTLLTILLIFCLYQILDKRGLYFALIILNIFSLVLSFKISYILKMNINLGIIGIVSIFSIIYIIISKYGYKDTKNILLLSFFSNIITSILLAIMNYYVPTITETISINMEGTFQYNYKILIFFPCIILLSQYIVIKLYKLITELQNNISIGVMLTYIITGLLYTIILYLLSYINILNFKDSLFLGVSTYIMGIPLTIINLIIINYIVNRKVIR